MLIFYTNDQAFQEITAKLDFGEARVTENQKEALQWIEEALPKGQCFLFLDFDFEKKKTEKFNTSLLSHSNLIRIIFSGEKSFPKLKKHQNGKTAAHGYLQGPLTSDMISGVLSDFKLADFVSENQLFDEGATAPSAKKEGLDLGEAPTSVSLSVKNDEVSQVLEGHMVGQAPKEKT